MQYANNGSLLSYLDQNINKLTWKDKLQHLKGIAYYLKNIHDVGLVHCDLHGRTIAMYNNIPLILLRQADLTDVRRQVMW